MKPKGMAVRRGENPTESAVLASYIESAGASEARFFSPEDCADFNDALCSGRFDRAIFVDLGALLTAIWSGHAKIDRWKAGGVTIELANPPEGGAGSWREYVDATYDSYTRWCRGQRRNQIVAACVLSALALAAVIVLFTLIPSRP